MNKNEKKKKIKKELDVDFRQNGGRDSSETSEGLRWDVHLAATVMMTSPTHSARLKFKFSRREAALNSCFHITVENPTVIRPYLLLWLT